MSVPMLVARYFAELKYIKDCKKYFTSDFDAVFIQSTTVAGFAVRAVRKNLPNAIVTFNVQDIFPYNLMYAGKMKRNSLMFTVLAAAQRYGYKHSDHIITISEDMKETLVDDGTPAMKIEVIYNWSYQDEPYINVDLSPVLHMFSPDYFNVVYAGNLGIMQNVDILIETARLLKNDKKIWFHIIGNGVYKEKLEAKSKEYGLTNINFWPIQPSELAPAIYSAADVNVIPLANGVYRTALPSKTATCMACGKPIVFAIGNDSKFVNQVAKDTGIAFVSSGDADGLSSCILNIKNGSQKMNLINFYINHIGRSSNSKKYAEIICKHSI